MTDLRQYLDLLKDVLENGVEKGDRTGTGTISVFARQMRFSLEEGFPLMTTKKLHIPSIVHELLWFLSGDTNIHYLQENKVRIWNEWADENGDLGPVYGEQWRAWKNHNGEVFDQIMTVIDELRTNPNSRRLLVNAWNVGELSEMALPPCHYAFQFYVANGKLSCMLNQRSCDMFLGVPFNIASYALLTHMVAQQLDLGVGEFIWSGGDVHIYNNHLEQVRTQLQRVPYPLPKLVIKRKPDSIFDYQYEDFAFENYQHHERIAAVVSV